MAHHRQFLDLTDGGGGDALPALGSAIDAYEDDDDEDDDDQDNDEDQDDNASSSHNNNNNKRNKNRNLIVTGQEQTGRWTKDEHEAFLQGLQLYGKEWKKVAAKVKTRTVVQTRTHAQKYFQKMQRLQHPGISESSMMMNMSNDDHYFIDGIIEPTVSIASTQRQRKKQAKTTTSSSSPAVNTPGSVTATAVASGQKVSSRPTTTSKAATEASSPEISLAPLSRSNNLRGSSTATLSAAQVISNFNNNSSSQHQHQATADAYMPAPPPKHGFALNYSTTHDDDDNMLYSQLASYTQQQHPSRLSNNNTFSSSARPWSMSGGGSGSNSSMMMKIVAPDPSANNFFPEPSPAATGKRKLAEIAAARMLAGVGSADTPTEEDGRETPPLPVSLVSSNQQQQQQQPYYANLEEAPVPPLTAAAAAGATDVSSRSLPLSSSSSKGLSLQIVNPSHLLGMDDYDDDHHSHRRRHGFGGGDSPQTPWDGQLEALVTAKSKTMEANIMSLKSDEPFALMGIDRNGASVDLGIPETPVDTDMEATAPPPPPPGPTYPVCMDLPDVIVRSELHKAVVRLDIMSMQNELSNTIFINQPDSAGFYPLHSAAALGMLSTDQYATAQEMVASLLRAGADPNKTDSNGNNPLHWAARAGDKATATVLVHNNCNFDVKNQDGETPLHWALRAGRAGTDVATVLLTNGARPAVLNKSFRRPVDVAADGFLDVPASLESLRSKASLGKKVGKVELKKAIKDSAIDRRDTRANLFLRSLQSKTLVLHHPECLEHHPKSDADWEAPDRIVSIMRRILPSSDSTGDTETSGIFPYEITASTDFERAKLDLLSRIHSTEYLSFVNDLSKDLERQLKQSGADPPESERANNAPPVVPFTPLVQRSMIKISHSQVKLGINSDTSFSAGSLKAARRAAGAVQHAVDCVLVGRNRNAFCVVRPPGHHAGVSGLLEGGESCGFCIFNNVAAGALYAISDDRLLCKRCAIVDIDVHHGNGTEEIIKRCHDPRKLFFFSIHLYDNDKKKRSGNGVPYKFYPGTGSDDDVALNIINVPIVPLWRDPNYSNAQGSKQHNTRGKTRHHSQESVDDSSETETLRGAAGSKVSDGGSESGSVPAGSTSGQSTGLSGRLAYRQAIQSRLLPALRAFDPDLILISAGFDAAKGDVGNARHEKGGERVGLDLEPEDYAWTTRKILEIADICCQGRVVSVLEGGYGRTATAPGGDASGLDRTMFAECAIRHLHSMIDPYDTEKRFS